MSTTLHSNSNNQTLKLDEELIIPIIVSDGAKLPRYATEDSAAVDLHACLNTPIELSPGKRTLIPTGLKMAIPSGWEGGIRPRSGLANKHGVTVLNTPGTVDADYRGEIKVILINLGEEPFVIEQGMRIAQMIFSKVTPAQFIPSTTLPETSRGCGGFGSTGRH